MMNFYYGVLLMDCTVSICEAGDCSWYQLCLMVLSYVDQKERNFHEIWKAEVKQENYIWKVIAVGYRADKHRDAHQFPFVVILPGFVPSSSSHLQEYQPQVHHQMLGQRPTEAAPAQREQLARLIHKLPVCDFILFDSSPFSFRFLCML